MKYNIKSLGYKTDFIFNKLDGALIEREEYLVASTESNPHFFWGNLLFFKRAPIAGDFNKWKSLFQEEFTHPSIYHMTFAWDSVHGEVGDCSEFLANGFELDETIVLCTSAVKKPRKFNSEVEVKIINLDKELERCVEIQVSSADNHLSKKAWEDFYTTSMNNYKSLIKEGHGKWFGAYLNGELVGSLGLFKSDTIGRFQVVSTDPKFQRKGICSTLVYKASLYSLNEMNLNELVMVADENYHAARIYESVGFVPTQKQVGLCWWDKDRLN